MEIKGKCASFCFLLLAWAASVWTADFGEICGGSTGDTCDDGLMCKILWKGCSSGICTCEDNYERVDDTCKKVLGYDEGDCTDTENNVCAEHLDCFETNKCECTSGPYDENYPDLCLAGKLRVGEDCVDDNDGDDDNLNCVSGVCDNYGTGKCICPPGEMDFDGNGYCRKPVYGEDCQPDNDQCYADNNDTVVCDAEENKCSCVAAQIPWQDKTLGCKVEGSAKENQACSDTEICKGSELVCAQCDPDDVFVCRYPYKESGAGQIKESLALLMAGIVLYVLYV